MTNARRPLLYVAFVFLVLGAAFSTTALLSSRTALAGGPMVRAGTRVVGVDQVASVPLDALEIPDPGAGAWLIDVTYDSNVVAATGCTVPQTTAFCNPFFAVDTVRVTGIDATGITGDFELANMQFLCGGIGTSPLTVTAHLFADSEFNDIAVTVMNGSVTCSTELVGDTNCDDAVNSIDALLILQFSAALVDDLPCPNGDVNDDAAVNPIDATLVLQYAAGLIDSLPPP